MCFKVTFVKISIKLYGPLESRIKDFKLLQEFRSPGPTIRCFSPSLMLLLFRVFEITR
jgi:hypothetical protein